MSSPAITPIPGNRLWTGRILTALVVLFLIFDGVGKLLKPAAVVKGTVELGYSPGVIVTLGVLLLSCVALYLIPRTSILGAVLLTGYLGGAVATQVRVGNPWFSHILFPVYLGVMIWSGIVLRDARLRELFPFRTERRD